MAIVSIDSIGLSGINSDLDAWNLPLESVSYANNFRVLDDKLQSFNGNTVLATPISNFYAGK